VAAQRSTARRALRWLSPGSAPLRRTEDRIELLARLLLIGSLLIGVAVALVVASVSHASALTEAAAQSVERQQVDAVLVADPPALTSLAEDVPPVRRAAAEWHGPPGGAHAGLVVVPMGARAGSTVSIWVDRDGDLTTRPLGSGDAVARAVGMAAGTFLCLSALAVGLFVTVLNALDRSRLRRWAADWAAVEPVWTRRVP
jgi:hypothetical protein